jgi:hypothetical protein
MHTTHIVNLLAFCMLIEHRLSIFFTLPYWENLKVNHLLDPMHIFVNVASNLWDHLTGSKDSVEIWQDLQCTGRMRSVWPIEKCNGQITLPPAPWCMSKDEEKDVKQVITKFRTPTGYMRCLKGAFSKIKRRGVEQLSGLKSHDWHKMLPVCTYMY